MATERIKTRLADSQAHETIIANCERELINGICFWYDIENNLSGATPEELSEVVDYLASRGLAERHPAIPHLMRFISNERACA